MAAITGSGVLSEREPLARLALPAAVFSALGAAAVVVASIGLGAIFGVPSFGIVPALGQGGGAAAGAAAALAVTVSEFKFGAAEFKLAAPGEFTVTLDNKGMIDHDFSIEGVDGKVLAKAGTSATGTFTLAKAGTYTIFCSVTGHKEAGMKASLTVGGA